jgi:hypothetical protein
MPHQSLPPILNAQAALAPPRSASQSGGSQSIPDYLYRSPNSTDDKIERFKMELENEPAADEPFEPATKHPPHAQSASSAPASSAPSQRPAPPPANAPHTGSHLHPDLEELVAGANKGDPQSLTQIKTLLDENPENCMRLGNLAETAERLMFQRIAGNNQLVLESFRRKAAAMRDEISTPEDTPLVTLAVQRVIACWLQLQYLDVVDGTSQWTPIQATQWARRQESAERRYQVALKSLGLARRMTKGAPCTPRA